MCKAYISGKESIVIKSSINKIDKALDIPKNNSFQIKIREVKYIDFHNTSLNYEDHILSPLFFKDTKYKFENELRLIVWKRPENNILNTSSSNFDFEKGDLFKGISLNIDLSILIEEIYVNSDDLRKKVKKLLPKSLKDKVIKKFEFGNSI